MFSWKKWLFVCSLVGGIFASTVAPSSAFLDKTRFVAHLGVAYFCFHHWVVKPYEEGAFQSGAPHRISSIVKGGVALLFAVHEVKVAQKIAETSNDPLLKKLDAGVIALAGSFAAVGDKLKSGNFAPQDVQGLTSVTNLLSSQAAAGGEKIKDVPVTIPGN
jgi:hypothetical protein